ncbi:MAG: hypothetical protein LBN34_07265 [Clostridiales Family XIII bacterium]|jgi:hypothetical protein|nr:hypothetical protein [Clostridiales Family XIII bacterium]
MSDNIIVDFFTGKWWRDWHEKKRQDVLRRAAAAAARENNRNLMERDPLFWAQEEIRITLLESPNYNDSLRDEKETLSYIPPIFDELLEFCNDETLESEIATQRVCVQGYIEAIDALLEGRESNSIYGLQDADKLHGITSGLVIKETNRFEKVPNTLLSWMHWGGFIATVIFEFIFFKDFNLWGDNQTIQLILAAGISLIVSLAVAGCANYFLVGWDDFHLVGEFVERKTVPFLKCIVAGVAVFIIIIVSAFWFSSDRAVQIYNRDLSKINASITINIANSTYTPAIEKIFEDEIQGVEEERDRNKKVFPFIGTLAILIEAVGVILDKKGKHLNNIKYAKADIEDIALKVNEIDDERDVYLRNLQADLERKINDAGLTELYRRQAQSQVQDPPPVESYPEPEPPLPESDPLIVDPRDEVFD